MSTLNIFYVAIVTFGLMMIGVVLTAREFKRMDDASTAGSGEDAPK